MASRTTTKPGRKSTSFRIGRVRAYLRGRVWYLCYREHGRRRQPRVGPDREEAKRLAAEINAQLESGSPSALGFEPISIQDLRDRWLEQHEHVRRSSLSTISRYRSATQHLVNFITSECPLRRASDFQSKYAEAFVKYLRSIRVAPNGHPHAKQRRLRDSGVRYVLETCSTLFNYAQRHRHLSPYAENPFRAIEISRIPIEDAKPVVAFDDSQMRKLLEACDDWQFPIFVTFALTGLRPGELTHLLLPEDLDLDNGWLRIRNKPALGWRIKTRNERDLPLVPELIHVLTLMRGTRRTGPVFQQRRCKDGYRPPLVGRASKQLELEIVRRLEQLDASATHQSARETYAEGALTIWRDIGALKEDWIRTEFKALTKSVGLPEVTAPKTLRHSFATMLQDANVDPLIRNELMGHAPSSGSGTLGMTAIYTHTRPETKRQQLQKALQDSSATVIARDWCGRRSQF